MFIYVSDSITYYHLDAFRYDKEQEQIILIVANCSKEIVISNINKANYFKIRKEILFDKNFEISSKYFDWYIEDII